MSDRKEKLLAIAALLTESTETGRPLQIRREYDGYLTDYIDSSLLPVYQDDLDLDNWRVAPPPPKKVIDLSLLAESGIDCAFWNMAGDKTVGTLTDLDKPSVTYERDNGLWYSYCQPRMNHVHAWQGGWCPLPAGVRVLVYLRSGEYHADEATEYQWKKKIEGWTCDTDIIAFEVLGLADGYVWPWEVES